jgi:broad specificity phosphatase PhoE
MPTLTILRHCYTKKGASRGKGSHLSQAGVEQARRIGATLGPFDMVLTSTIPRTLETALAMGFAVDDQLAALGEIPLAVWDEIGHHERWEWEDPFAHFAAIIAQNGATAALGRQQLQIWWQTVQGLPEDGAALIISHGRIIEAGLVCCFPQADFPTWGQPFQHGEGIALAYEAGQWLLAHWLRNSERH